MEKDEVPVDLLERELRGLEVELSSLRQQHKTVTDRIVQLERQRFELDCKVRARRKEMPS